MGVSRGVIGIVVLGTALTAVAQQPQIKTDDLKAAVRKSLPLLQSADENFSRKSQCVSCHHNSLTSMTIAAARDAGIPLNDPIAEKQAKAVAAYAESWRGRLLEGVQLPGGADAVSYILVGLGAANHKSDPATDAMASFLLDAQSPDGRWRIQAKRPSLESSDFTVTATSLRALQLYGVKSNGSATDNAIQSALMWLKLAQPSSTEERTFQVLAFRWGGASEEMISGAAGKLAAEQRPDGGWSQLPHMPSDAYSTGEALVALQEAGAWPAAGKPTQRGIQFLLETQLEDGSWQVKTRSTPIQPYFESGFPHGPAQWISAAATNWATRALCLAIGRW